MAQPLAELKVIDGYTWGLFSWLPGRSHESETSDQRRERGRYLALLHQDLATLTDIAARPGFPRADEVLHDPELEPLLHSYEAVSPKDADILLFHLQWARGHLPKLPKDASTTILHGDFAPWNLLLEDDGTLSGILGFEATHRGLRVSDFALSWRGYQDEVLEGYDSIVPLDSESIDQIMPAYFAWLFMGIKDQLRRGITHGSSQAADLSWEIAHFLRREGLLAAHVPHYHTP